MSEQKQRKIIIKISEFSLNPLKNYEQEDVLFSQFFRVSDENAQNIVRGVALFLNPPKVQSPYSAFDRVSLDEVFKDKKSSKKKAKTK